MATESQFLTNHIGTEEACKQLTTAAIPRSIPHASDADQLLSVIAGRLSGNSYRWSGMD